MRTADWDCLHVLRYPICCVYVESLPFIGVILFSCDILYILCLLHVASVSSNFWTANDPKTIWNICFLNSIWKFRQIPVLSFVCRRRGLSHIFCVQGKFMEFLWNRNTYPMAHTGFPLIDFCFIHCHSFSFNPISSCRWTFDELEKESSMSESITLLLCCFCRVSAIPFRLLNFIVSTDLLYVDSINTTTLHGEYYELHMVSSESYPTHTMMTKRRSIAAEEERMRNEWREKE